MMSQILKIMGWLKVQPSWERNITFPWNKEIFNLCFRCHILRSYRFVVEVTFNVKCSFWQELPIKLETLFLAQFLYFFNNCCWISPLSLISLLRKSGVAIFKCFPGSIGRKCTWKLGNSLLFLLWILWTLSLYIHSAPSRVMIRKYCSAW